MLPNFLHVGAAKAASTFLWSMYQEHPDIYVPQTFTENGKTMNADNPNFFIGSYHRGLGWYEKTFFAGHTNEKAAGETSNSYMLSETALMRIARDLPSVKISMILRNPVEIAFLQYVMNRKSGSTGAGQHVFESMLDSHAWQYFRQWAEPGFFGAHLERIYRHFPKDQVYIAFYEDLHADAKMFLQGFFRYLGVDETFVPRKLNEIIGFPGTGGSDTRDNDIEKGFSVVFGDELRQVFEEDIRGLEKLTGRDLTGWRNRTPYER